MKSRTRPDNSSIVAAGFFAQRAMLALRPVVLGERRPEVVPAFPNVGPFLGEDEARIVIASSVGHLQLRLVPLVREQ